MQCKLKDILIAIPALSKLARSDLTLKTAYHLQKTLSALQQEADFFAAKREELLEKHKESESDAQKALDELLALEVEPDISIVQVPITENIKLSPNDIGALLPFIKIHEEESL